MRKLSDKEVEQWAKRANVSKEQILFHTNGGIVHGNKLSTAKITSEAVSESNRNRIWSKESKEKIAKYVINRHKTDPVYAESRRNCGVKNGMYGRNRSGPNNPRFGVKLSQETKDKIRKSHLQRHAKAKQAEL